ncbi:E3 ubiquitin-protein ligase MIB2-like [Ostrea edulis]|uniref:E3 ubiquitin-protein ligase MIB2-like n=1 Tax=Ostrea edulis TaxID=37623 RepID=UPI0024AF88BD|nr:E3 ubiquitin-protein ligase MIB2-like [Ostrea edulis]
MASNDNPDEDMSQIKKEIQTHFAVSGKVPECSTFAGMKIVDFFDRDEIKTGLRVVRGVDWDQADQDGGEGNVGTVVNILDDSQRVRVQWDSQATLDATKNGDIFNYRTGKDNKYDLLVFDNAQTGKNIVKMILYRYARNSVSVGVRADVSYLKARGIFKHEKVTSRKDPKVAGTVEDIEDDIVNLYNCDAKVAWEGEEPLTRHRVGREGKVDIKFTKPAEKKYFQDHLQEINKDNAVVGIRVVKRSHEDHVIVGTITSVKGIKSEKNDSKEKDEPTSTQRESLNLHQIPKSQNMHCLLTVQWDHGPNNEDVETRPGDILLFDNSQIGIEHDAKCKECCSKIKGMRWKCSKCPNYDLCTSCYMSAKDDHADHRFHRFTEPRKRTDVPRSSSEVKHSLYLIFAHNPEDNAGEPSGKDETLKDVKKFASSYQQN